MGLTPRRGSFVLDDMLLNGVATTSIGPVVRLYGVHPTTFTAEGDFEGIVTIYVNNQTAPDPKNIEQWAVLDELTKGHRRCITDGPYQCAAARFARKSGGVTVACCGATDVGHENGSLR